MKVVAGLDIGHIEQYYYQESLDNETKTGARIVRADDTEHTMYDVQCREEWGERRIRVYMYSYSRPCRGIYTDLKLIGQHFNSK